MADSRGSKDLSVKAQTALVTNAYEKVKKDNDLVYYDRVPEHKTLPVIDRAQLAKPTPVKFPISDDFKGS